MTSRFARGGEGGIAAEGTGLRVAAGETVGWQVALLLGAGELLMRSLEYETTLETVARIAVPALADCCLVDLLDERGSVRRVAIAHADPQKEALAWRSGRRPAAGAAEADDAARTVREGGSRLFAALSPEGEAEDPHPVLTRVLGLRSAMVVPLRARGRTLGALSFATSQPGRRYGAGDLALAEELASRCALAIDNARLHREARETSRTADRSLALLDSAIRDAPIGVALFDSEHRYVEINDTLAAINGVARADHIGRQAGDVVGAFGSRVAGLLRRVQETGEPIVDLELSSVSPATGTQERHWLTSFHPVRAGARGAPGIAVLAFDITARRATEDRLRTSQEAFRELVEAVPNAIIGVDASGGIAFANRAAVEMLGSRRQELVEGRIQELVPDVAWPPAAHEHAGGFSVELTVGPTGGEGVVTAVLVDVSERSGLQDALIHMALHDALTGLPSRALLFDRIDLALARLERRSGTVGLILIDLDRYKVVNDSLGHGAGDEVLSAAAGRLEQAVRPGDTVARLGGDEFAVLCDQLPDVSAAIAIAKRISEAFRRPFMIEQQELVVTVSAGIACTTDPAGGAKTLMRNADITMYRVKARGGDGFEVFDRRMRSRAVERLRVERMLRSAIRDDGFAVHYQPVFSIETGEVVAAEALIRWDHRRYGMLGPADFIPVAEEIGFMAPIGRYVLEEACIQAGHWHARRPEAPISVCVNMSPSQLADASFPGFLEYTLGQTGVDPVRLCLEITEGVLIGDTPVTRHALAAIKELGVKLAIDDFGTGYSALGYLRRFEVDLLKIDRSFIQAIGDSPHSSAIVAAVINMGGALDLRVVAEGVETEDQLALLRGLGCGFAQGHHLARAMPAEELDRLLRDRSGRPPGSEPGAPW